MNTRTVAAATNPNYRSFPLTLSLSLESSSACSLLVAVQKSTLLSASSREKLEELVLGYPSTVNLTARQESILLHQLIYEVIRSSNSETLEDEEIDSLFALEDQATEILKGILPAGTDVEKFLSQLSTEKVVIERLLSYRNFYQAQEELLNRSAETVNSAVIAKYEEMKARFLEFSKGNEALNESLRRKIEELSQEIYCLGERFEKLKTEAQNSGEGFNDLQNITKLSSRFF